MGITRSIGGFGYAAPTLTIPIRNPLTFQAEFRSTPLTTIASTPAGGEIYVDDVAYYTPARFDWTAGSVHAIEIRGPLYSLTGAWRYVFSGWEDGSISTSRTVAATGTATTYSANFSTQNFLNWDWVGSGIVSVNPSAPNDYYDVGHAGEFDCRTARDGDAAILAGLWTRRSGWSVDARCGGGSAEICVRGVRDACAVSSGECGKLFGHGCISISLARRWLRWRS
ncbi:MAG: hypothetical protein WDO18_00730 [Acidobacteriota bacterium]